MQANYYSVLGLKRTALQPEIKAAYKRLAIQYHPDKHQGNTYFEEQFKLVNEAYQVLGNPQKRASYDLKLDYLAQQIRIQQQQRAYYARQRPPASVHERYYRPIPKKQQFIRRDWQIAIGLILIIFLAAILVKEFMDEFTAKRRFHAAQELVREKKWEGAYSLLSEAIDFEPEYTDAYMKRAFINQQIYKDCRAAVADYSAALEYGAKPSAETYYQRGTCYAQMHEYQQAERDFNLAIQADSSYNAAYFSRGELRLFNRSAWAEAINDLNIYLQHPASETEKYKAMAYRGFAYYLSGQYENALRDYDEVLSADARNVRIYYLIGKVEVAQGKRNEACRSFRKAYEAGYQAALPDIEELCGRH